MKNGKQILKDRFKEIGFKKIILYRNPSECNSLKLERVNPNHVGIIWGRRRKELNKGTSYGMIAKVYFNALPVMFGLSVASWLDAFTGYAYNILINIGLMSLLACAIIAILYYLSCDFVFKLQKVIISDY